jgi:glycine oxidase
MPDCCIIGGGIVGLSIARELAGRGARVRVLTRESRRDTASWAAAGILPPAPERAGAAPGDALTAWSDRLHRVWARELLDETGIDNGLRMCGGLHVGAGPATLGRLAEEARGWRAAGAACEMLDARTLAEREPALADAVGRGVITDGYLLSEEMQIRPPRHLEALERSCHGRGVAITHDVAVHEIVVESDRVAGVVADTPRGRERIEADTWVLAAGAWSGGLAERLGLAIVTKPVRGQIALFSSPQPGLRFVVNRGLDYLVPRADGALLVGSTIEDAGFDRSTRDEAIDRLVRVARELLGPTGIDRPSLAWAGLRPGSADGLPFIGRSPACANAFVAAGHFRAGLHQSTGTAVLVADLVEGRQPSLDMRPFDPARPAPADGCDHVAALVARAAAEA